MPSPERVYHGSVRALSGLMLLLGAGILVTTIVAGGGPLSTGFFLGVAFLGVGGGRLYMATRGHS